MRLAIYARQSKTDRDRVPSTAWQIEAAAKWAADRGDEVVATFADVDTSGYRKVARPQFAELLRMVEAGEVDGTLVWRLDRLSRQGQWGPDVLRFMSARAAHDTALLSVVEDTDTTTSAGKLILGVRLQIAESESEAISTRWRAAKQREAAAGVPRSGGHRWFGWVEGHREVDPVEAALVVDAAHRLLTGASLRGIVLEWNADGVTTSTGRPWVQQTLRQMLRSRRLCGVRELHGVEVGPAVWPSILDRDTSDRLRRLLDDPGRRTAGRPHSGLLSGIARCGRCGHAMRLGTSPSGKPRYSCPPKPEGCNGCAVLAADADEVVVRRIRARVDAGKLPSEHDPAGPLAPLAARLVDLEGRLAEAAADYYGARLITREQFTAASDSLTRQITTTRTALARAERSRSAAVLPSDLRGMVGRWGSLDLTQRRAAVRAMCEELRIAQGTGGRFDAHRIKIRWRS